MGDNIDELFGAFEEEVTEQSVQVDLNVKRKLVESQENGNSEEQFEEISKKQKKDTDENIDEKIYQDALVEEVDPNLDGDEASDQKQKMYNVEHFEIKNDKGKIENCWHEVFYPEGYEFKPKPKRPAAKEYPFKLDHFQRKAVNCIECNESVLVAAHTSAGKTAVAEYAIAQSLRDKQKVIYTSPIKALSNQKYRELQKEFKDVGLVTGDVSINQTASCLVMTTEILRSMLYRGSEITREVAWVIFDEVHYMRDKERGVVWEETMILLNQNVRYVFLSATIPNAGEFAEWICRIKKQPCHVVYTDYRPVPLQHFIFPTGGEGIYLIVDHKGTFREDNFQKALSVMGDNIDLTNTDKKKRKKPTEGAELNKILKLISTKNLEPAIVFSFSKRDVESYAKAMNNMDLTTQDEKEKIDSVFQSAISQLAEEDQKLPQITQILPILKRGIGMHHGGLLPIVKEIIEILFQQGWLKILFSTETFSMGLNMPARTVVFTSVRKFDGEDFRWIQGGEYIQMSGRAGRRGKDDKGFTILMVDQKMEPEVAKGMLKGQADPLNSSFHLCYNMLINSMRLEDNDPEYIIRRSLHQFQNDKQLPQMKEKYNELVQKKDSIAIQNEGQIAEICKFREQIKIYEEKERRIVIQEKYVLPYLHIGRLIRVQYKNQDWGWGISINFHQKKVQQKKKKKSNEDEPEDIIIVDIMCHIKPRQNNEEPKPALITEEGELEVIPMNLSTITEISSIKLDLPSRLDTLENKLLIKETLKEIRKQFPEVPKIHPIKDMKILNDELIRVLDKKDKLKESMEKEMQKSEIPNLQQQIEQYEQKQKLQISIIRLKEEIEKSQKMVLQDDLACMKRVMRRLGFISKDQIVQLPGKVACEVSACDEILATQLLLSNFFNEMSPNHIAALLSCLVHDENNSQENQQIQDQDLALYFEKVLEIAKGIFTVMQESKMQIEEKDYLGALKPQLMEVVYKWCQGSSFADICKLTNCYEGSIIRCMRRLDELLKQMESACKVMGNEILGDKFKEASKNLKRGIIFAASLYV
ncbi:hypothetical protein ABPG72_015767 [Tetrahymena utriculariae]